MLDELRGRADKLSENFNEEVENRKKEPEMKITLEGIDSRLDGVEDRIGDLEDNAAENTRSEQLQEERIQNNEDGLRGLWGNVERTNVCVIKMPEGDERARRELKIHLKK